MIITQDSELTKLMHDTNSTRLFKKLKQQTPWQLPCRADMLIAIIFCMITLMTTMVF